MGDGKCGCGGGSVSGVVVLGGARRGDDAVRRGDVLDVLQLAVRRRVEAPLRRVDIVLRSGGVEAEEEEEVVGGTRRVVFSSVQPQPGRIRLVCRVFASSLHCR